jgi:hypothetical protein
MAVATLTNRTSLGLHSGDKIEFFITETGEALLIPVTKKVDEVFGILHKPGRKPVSIEEMDAAINQKMRDAFK